MFSRDDNNVETNLYVGHVKGLNVEFENKNTFGPFSEYDRDITMSDVEKIVNKSKDKKAPGFDRIVNELMNDRICIDILTELFNKCHSLGLLPSN